jgi:thymidylate synthase (FAD)
MSIASLVNPVRIELLTHGYIEVIETWGSDERIIESARMSTDGAFRGWGPIHESSCDKFLGPTARVEKFGRMAQVDCSCQSKAGDEKLLRHLFLSEPQHSTPFEMAGITFEVQAPIFVFREWHRHRTQSYNEMSARYTPLPDFNYIPSPERCMHFDVHGNKQAQGIGDKTPTHEEALDWLTDLADLYIHIERVYRKGLDIGVPKEIARCAMSVARFSRMRASANLFNWVRFFGLRAHPKAQQEIQQYAYAAMRLAQPFFPRTFELIGEKRARYTSGGGGVLDQGKL